MITFLDLSISERVKLKGTEAIRLLRSAFGLFRA
jgi:hypothetical protein